MNKKAVMDEGITMMYRIILVAFVALVILGISSVFYSHYIDVRNAEAKILARQIADCFTLKKMNYREIENGQIFSSCSLDSLETSRFFVRLTFTEEDKTLKQISDGDSGKEWIKELYENSNTQNIKQYAPGNFSDTYDFYDSTENKIIKMKTEVLVTDE